MTRFLALTTALVAFAGCSHREEIPEITRQEYEEARRQIWGAKSEAAQYLSTPEGRLLVDKRLRRMFGDIGLATMRAATRVETFRIVDPGSRHSAPKHRGEEIEGFSILSRGGDQGPEFASKLSDRLLYGALYFYNPDCWEDPGVAYRLWDGEDSVTLVVCYECYHLQVFVRDARGGLVHESKSFFRDRFDGPDVLPELAKQAFPSDAEIQALRMTR